VQTFTERLMIYGLGRSVTYHDQPAIRAIVRNSRPSQYRFSDLVMGVVESDQFRLSKAPAKAAQIKPAVVASNAPEDVKR
jgi:hypothetical protein